jgi:drug/metabolite transporter (DMT)-like permease
VRITPYQMLFLGLFAVLLATGQVLFRLSAGKLVADTRLPDLVVNLFRQPIFWGACLIYGLTTVLWVWLLTKVPLSLAYPFVTLALVIVPIISWMYFSEPLSVYYWVGMTMIIVGACVIVQS